MNLSGMYVIDKGIILQKAYYLLCIVFANKEIARRSHPHDKSSPLAVLEGMFLESEVSRLLLEIAVAIRVLDDQMMALPNFSPEQAAYLRKRDEVDKLNYQIFEFDPKMTLRIACNKIIHSNTMSPHTRAGSEAHEHDAGYLHGDGEKEIDWKHLSGQVRLSGFYKKTEWYVLLDIEMFITAVQKILQ